MYVRICIYVYIYMHVYSCQQYHARSTTSIPKHANTASMHMHMYTKCKHMQTLVSNTCPPATPKSSKPAKICIDLQAGLGPRSLDEAITQPAATGPRHGGSASAQKLAPGHTRLKPLSAFLKSSLQRFRCLSDFLEQISMSKALVLPNLPVM